MNRIRIVLADLIKNKCLADKIGKKSDYCSQWYNNAVQNSVETLFDIAKDFYVNVKTINANKC